VRGPTSSSGPVVDGPAVLARMQFSDLDPVGAALLGCMISLTPGTTTIDIDMERGEMLLHLLDASDPASTIAIIREQFEPHMRALFPARRWS
jgi:multisubunit Na+/H+ antiporter MnhE subunit